MKLVPVDKVGQIEFYESHLPPWTTNAVAIGTTAGAVTNLETLTEAARAAYEAQRLAQDAAKDATLAFNDAVKAMARAGADIVRQIRAQGAIQGNSVYVLASIPAPATPGPVGVPGTPYEFAAELMQDGGLDIAWKCKNPAGCTHVLYQVWRRVGGTGPFTYVGGNGQKKFLDSTIPSGTSQLTYQIQAVRSTGIGNWAQYNVTFGNLGIPGAQTVTVTQAEALPRMAA